MHWLSRERGRRAGRGSAAPGRGARRGGDAARGVAPLGVLLLTCAPTAGQRLDLGAPQAPVLTRPSALDELQEGLTEQERGFTARSGDPRARASAALRRLALALAEEPESETRVLLGMTLASRLSALDRVIGAGEFDDASAILLARDAQVLASDLPDEQEELDRRMRELLAELSRACGELPAAGWGARAGDPPAEGDAARWKGALDESESEALHTLMAALEASRAWPVLDRGAAPVRGALAHGAHAALEGPAWLTDDARVSLRALLVTALRGLTQPELRRGAIGALAALEGASRAIALANRLPAGEPTNEARARLSEMLRNEPGRAAATLPLLALALCREGMATERVLVRPLRPAWRVLAQRARESEAGLLAVLGRAIEAGPSDPGVVGAIRSHQRSVEALAGLETLSRLCSGGATGDDPAVEQAWTRLAQAALEASRRMEEPENAERMLAFEALLEQANRMERLGQAERLDLSPEEDSHLCGGRAGDLRVALETCRAEWARAWAEQGSAPGEVLARLGVLEGLLSTLEDARTWGQMVEGPGAAARLTAWELATPSLRLAGEDASEQLAETTRLVLAGELARADERLARWREEFALLRLAARLEREARARGLTPGETTGASAIAELGAGAPGVGEPLFAERRGELATICRYASELAPMRKAGAREQERQLRRFVQWKAGAMLEALGAEGAGHVSSSASR